MSVHEMNYVWEHDVHFYFDEKVQASILGSVIQTRYGIPYFKFPCRESQNKAWPNSVSGTTCHSLMFIEPPLFNFCMCADFQILCLSDQLYYKKHKILVVCFVECR